MSKVATLSVQSVIRPTTGRPVTPAPAPKQDSGSSLPAAPALAPGVQAFASTTLTALIQAQAKATRQDPQPTHGHDQDHGHKPADPPPVVTPPVITPPVAQPPVAEPPVSVDPPVVTSPPTPRPERVDTAVAPRLQAMLARSLAERDEIRESTAAFIAFAAERQAFAAINRNGVATALLQGFKTYA